MEKIKYSQIRPRLKTFDVLCCIPPGLFMGWIQHTVGVYVCAETGQISAYQSTTQKYAGKSGVSLTPMAEFVDRYIRAGGRILLRKCTIKGSGRRGRAQQDAAKHIKMHRGKPYPDLKTRAGRWYVVNARIDIPFWRKNPWVNQDRTDIFFCAHLIANEFRFCQLTKGKINAAEVDTRDLRAGGSFEDVLGDGVSLDYNEIQIIRG
ncbi:hypothetical protein LCGC14_3090660, partial [marine sediment metagenome]|nr:hypothetical protein [Phycisphaerales bacterium]